eukprot:COSAG02_NODE_6859_length_3324_cov_1.717519_5_plen_57_part_00
MQICRSTVPGALRRLRARDDRGRGTDGGRAHAPMLTHGAAPPECHARSWRLVWATD